MTDIIKLTAEKRNEKISANELRAKNILPAVIYGPNSENIRLSIKYRDFTRALEQAGESTLIDLSIDKAEPVKVLVQDLQQDPVSEVFTHADLYQLDMNEKLKVEIELKILGIEEIEKISGGEVIKTADKLEVECLPKDLVKELEVDLTEKLKEIGDVFHAKDVKLTTGLILAVAAETPIASLMEIKEEIIPEAAAAAAETAAEKTEGEGKEPTEDKDSAEPASEREKDGKAEKTNK